MQDVLVQTVNVRLKNLSSQQASTDSGGFAGSAKSCWAFLWACLVYVSQAFSMGLCHLYVLIRHCVNFCPFSCAEFADDAGGAADRQGAGGDLRIFGDQ